MFSWFRSSFHPPPRGLNLGWQTNLSPNSCPPPSGTLSPWTLNAQPSSADGFLTARLTCVKLLLIHKRLCWNMFYVSGSFFHNFFMSLCVFLYLYYILFNFCKTPLRVQWNSTIKNSLVFFYNASERCCLNSTRATLWIPFVNNFCLKYVI